MSEEKNKGFKNVFKEFENERKKKALFFIVVGLLLMVGLALYIKKTREEEFSRFKPKTEKPVKVVRRDTVKESWYIEKEKELEELRRKLKEQEAELQRLKRGDGVQPPPKPPALTQSGKREVVGGDEGASSGQPEEVRVPVEKPPVKIVVGDGKPQDSKLPLIKGYPPPPPPGFDGEVGGDSGYGPQIKPVKKYVPLEGLIAYKDTSGGSSKGIGVVKSKDEEEEKKKGGIAGKKVDKYIPAGSFLEAILLSGVDAPTEGSAAGSPVPVLMEVTDLTVLPNRFRSDIRKCFIIGSARGDLAAERAYIRLELLSCVKEDGTVVEKTVTGYVAGEDGKNGLVGRVVSKQGTVIARALVAGFVEGVSKAFNQSFYNVSVSPLGQVQTIQPEDAFKAGAAQGFAEASRKLVDFYLKLASQLVPVIEINAGREVDIVFTKGVDLGS